MTKIACPLSVAAKEFANHPAIVTDDQILTYYQYDSAVSSFAHNLADRGVKSGDRVAIISNSGASYPIAILAIIRAGGVACPISTRFPSEQLQSIMETIAPDFMLLGRKYQNLTGVLPRQSIIIEDLFENQASQNSNTDKIDLEMEATVMLSSGTTAQPKAIVHTYANHYYNALGSNENIVLAPGNRWLLSLPLYHVGGLAIVFRALLSGVAVVIPPAGVDLAEAIRRYSPTHISLVSAQLKGLLRDDSSTDRLRKLRAILLGGGPASAVTIGNALEQRLPLLTTYGLTEMASQVTTSQVATSQMTTSQVTTSGKMLPHREVSISTDGEILVRGACLFKGYLINGKVSTPTVDGDGWFHTGDLGSVDNDGCLTVTGRKDNMFVSGGENIYPEEIERVLLELRGIEEAVVVPINYAEWGQRPVVFIRYGEEKPTETELKSLVERRLPKFKIPDWFYDWPVAGDQVSGKPDRCYFKRLATEISNRQEPT